MHAYSRLHNYSPEQPDYTSKGVLGYYPHLSTETFHAIYYSHRTLLIRLLTHWFSSPTATTRTVPHKQTPREHGYPNDKPTSSSDYQVHTTELRHTLLTQEASSHLCNVEPTRSTPLHIDIIFKYTSPTRNIAQISLLIRR